MAHDDDDIQTVPADVSQSSLEAIVQQHPIAAILAAAVIGALLAKMAF